MRDTINVHEALQETADRLGAVEHFQAHVFVDARLSAVSYEAHEKAFYSSVELVASAQKALLKEFDLLIKFT